jgi:hypothetical protein
MSRYGLGLVSGRTSGALSIWMLPSAEAVERRGRVMRLLAARIEEYKAFQDQALPLEGLVVVFGANSSGKTNSLEAVAELIGLSGEQVRPHGGEGDNPALGDVIFDLDQVDVHGHADVELYRNLLTRDFGFAGQEVFDEETLKLLRKASPRQIQEHLTRQLINAGSAGSAEDRQLIGEAAARTTLFQVDSLHVRLVVVPSGLPQVVLDAAERVASKSPGESNDPLYRIAVHLTAKRLAPIGFSEDAGFTSEDWRKAYPEVMWLEMEPHGLGQQVRADLEALHSLMWGFNPERSGRFQYYPLTQADADEMTASVDPWLETQAPEGSETSASRRTLTFWSAASNIEAWSRIRPTMVAAATVLTRRANELAPAFVKERGTIAIQALPPTLWAERPDRVAIAVIERDDSQPYNLDAVGSGVARWVAASLRLAGRELRHATREVLDEAGAVITDPKQANRLLKDLRETADNTRIRLVPKPGRLPALYLVDEPEAHLHPAAVRSVADWLHQLSQQANGVIVATHERAFLEFSPEAATLVLASQEEGGARLTWVSGDRIQALERIRHEMGLSRADLLQLTRLILFVEGPHDVAVLEGMFADRLRAAGVCLIPIHGTDNVLALVDSEVIAALGIHTRVLFDHTNVQAVHSRRPSSTPLGVA